MANTSFIPSNQLDFNAYKASLKTFLKAQDKFTDYDFDGSNFAVLLDLLAYNAYNQNFYLNMVGSEMFLDTAQLRESIVSHAKELNYTPRSAVSARALIAVQIVPNDAPSAIVIPKFYQFRTTAANGTGIKFVTDQPIVIQKNSSNQYISDSFYIYEGVAVTEVFNVIATTSNDGYITYNQRFDLQSENVDVSSIAVTVKQNANDTNPVTYTRATSLYGLSGESNVFFVRGYKDNMYEIEFGDGVFGRALTAGNVVTVTYRDTDGSEGNGNYTFAKTAPIEGYSTITVTTLSRASGGADRETNDSIKFNAVRHFQTQDRAVVSSDYQSLVQENFPEIDAVNVYGGELVYQYGKVMIVLKPDNLEGVVDNTTKSRITEFLKTKSIVPEPVIVDPEYFYLGITGNVYYRSILTSLIQDQVKQAAISALVGLNDSELARFDVMVMQSLITETINDSELSILGSDVELSMIRRISPSFGVSRQYLFTLDNPVVSSSQGAYTNTTAYGITTNVFQVVIDDEITNVIIQDNGVGYLHLYEVMGDTKVKIAGSIGTVNYETGKVDFTVNVYSASPTIYVTAKMVNDTIDVSMNKFISIDSSYVSLNMVPVK